MAGIPLWMYAKRRLSIARILLVTMTTAKIADLVSRAKVIVIATVNVRTDCPALRSQVPIHVNLFVRIQLVTMIIAATVGLVLSVKVTVIMIVNVMAV